MWLSHHQNLDQQLSLEQLIASLMIHEMLVEFKSDKGRVRGVSLKGTIEEQEDDIAMMDKHFERHFKDQRKNFKGENSKKNNLSSVGCFRYGEFIHIIRGCRKWKDKLSKSNQEGYGSSHMWGDSDSGSEEDEKAPNHETCMTAIMDQGENSMAKGTRKGNNTSYFYLMAKKDVPIEHKVNIE